MPTNLDYASLEGLDEVRSVPFEFCPRLVTFISPKRVTTLRTLAPDRLDAFFGVGFGIKSITVEVTSDPLTQGLMGEVMTDGVFAEWEELRTMPEVNRKKGEYLKSELTGIAPSDFRREASS